MNYFFFFLSTVNTFFTRLFDYYDRELFGYWFEINWFRVDRWCNVFEELQLSPIALRVTLVWRTANYSPFWNFLKGGELKKNVIEGPTFLTPRALLSNILIFYLIKQDLLFYGSKLPSSNSDKLRRVSIAGLAELQGTTIKARIKGR